MVRCSYCHSVVIVPEPLRTGQKTTPDSTPKPAPQKPAQPPKPRLSEQQAIAKVTDLVRSGQELEAMKLYRETFPVGLKETKAAIEEVTRGLPLPIPDPQSIDEDPLPIEAAEQITHLAAQGQLEEAAQLYRITFGTSHVEAKTAVQQLAEGNSIDVAQQSAKRESQATAVRRKPPEANQPAPFRFTSLGIVLFILFVILFVVALVLIFSF